MSADKTLPEFDEEAARTFVADRIEKPLMQAELLVAMRWQHAQTQALIVAKDAEIADLKRQLAQSGKLVVNLSEQVTELKDEIENLYHDAAGADI